MLAGGKSKKPLTKCDSNSSKTAKRLTQIFRGKFWILFGCGTQLQIQIRCDVSKRHRIKTRIEADKVTVLLFEIIDVKLNDEYKKPYNFQIKNNICIWQATYLRQDTIQIILSFFGCNRCGWLFTVTLDFRGFFSCLFSRQLFISVLVTRVTPTKRIVNRRLHTNRLYCLQSLSFETKRKIKDYWKLTHWLDFRHLAVEQFELLEGWRTFVLVGRCSFFAFFSCTCDFPFHLAVGLTECCVRHCLLGCWYADASLLSSKWTG